MVQDQFELAHLLWTNFQSCLFGKILFVTNIDISKVPPLSPRAESLHRSPQDWGDLSFLLEENRKDKSCV